MMTHLWTWSEAIESFEPAVRAWEDPNRHPARIVSPDAYAESVKLRMHRALRYADHEAVDYGRLLHRFDAVRWSTSEEEARGNFTLFEATLEGQLDDLVSAVWAGASDEDLVWSDRWLVEHDDVIDG